MWTMDELVEQVRLALAAEYPGAPNARVRDVPDRRAIRWYVTTGLVDRPAGMRGRTAVYGPRHLLQIVAVKRRQAEGRSLAEIQAELAGATDDELAELARVPEPLLATGGPTAEVAPPRTRFWEISHLPGDWTIKTPLESPGSEPEPIREPGPPLAARTAAGSGRGEPGAPPASPARSKARTAEAPAMPAMERRAAEDALAMAAPQGRGPEGARASTAAPYVLTEETPRAVGGVALPGGVILVTPGMPTADDRAAIEAAARPLLDLLAERGLLITDGRTS